MAERLTEKVSRLNLHNPLGCYMKMCTFTAGVEVLTPGSRVSTRAPAGHPALTPYTLTTIQAWLAYGVTWHLLITNCSL